MFIGDMDVVYIPHCPGAFPLAELEDRRTRAASFRCPRRVAIQADDEEVTLSPRFRNDLQAYAVQLSNAPFNVTCFRQPHGHFGEYVCWG